jgi:epoxyqueuosine reductase
VDLKQKITAFAMELGLPLLGFTSADPFPQLRALMEERKSLNYLSGWEPKNPQLYSDPGAVLPGARSVICAALPYNGSSSGLETEKGRGIIGKFSRGIDYHQVLGDKLAKLLDYLKELVPGTEGVICVDTGPGIDRAFAQRSGLGFYGKNNTLITKEYGSWVFLGEIITNLELTPDQPIDLDCGQCRICLDSCPTGALVEPYSLDARKCLSYLTQSKGDIPAQFRETMGNQIYGCDLCQNCCPRNKNLSFISEQELIGPGELGVPELIWLLGLDNKEFKQNFGNTAAGWRGRTVLQRNAIIALANSGQREAIPILREKLKDQREIIRTYAKWALTKLQENPIDSKKIP